MSDDIETDPSGFAPRDEAGEDMHIHKPKAAHSLREFLSELVIIVVGILIALGLEQGLEQLHWREAVAAARDALHREIARNDGYFADRLAVSDCVERHIAQTDALIEQAARTGRTPNVEGVYLQVGHAIDASEWEAQKAAQTLVHFPAAERSMLSTHYRQAEDNAAWRDEERKAWDGLSVLDGPSKRLSDADIADLRVRLKVAAHLQELWRRNAAAELDLGRALDVVPRAPNLRWRAAACQDVRTV